MNFYYGLMDLENKIWEFAEESDKRIYDEEGHVKDLMFFVTETQWKELLDGQNQGLDIVVDNDEVVNAEKGRFFINNNGEWEKKTNEQFNLEKAQAKAKELVNSLYEIKAKKAYGGITINSVLVFETNQTAITNTVASLALMNDTDTANWKFYTLTGEPAFQLVTKQQLAYIAGVARGMMNDSFTVEGQFNLMLSNMTVEDLLSESIVTSFLEEAQAAMDAISSEIIIPTLDV